MGILGWELVECNEEEVWREAGARVEEVGVGRWGNCDCGLWA